MGKTYKYYFVYKTTNLINEKYYYGMHSTDNLNDGYIGSGTRLKRSVEKYGKENFKIEILEFLPNKESLLKKEKELINEYVLNDPKSMNLQPGGGGGICNEEHALKLKRGSSVYQKEKWKNPKYRENHLKILKDNFPKVKLAHNEGRIKYDTFTGKKHSEESKIKMSKAKIGLYDGEKNSQFGTCWITNGVENKKMKKEDALPTGWRLGRIQKNF
jgi:hypothetical protein